MKKINVNHASNTIEMSKATAKAASVFGSQSYNELVAAKRDFPEYDVIIVESQKRSNVFKGMDFPFMEKYIETHENEGKTLSVQFAALKESKLSYGEIKDWFIAQYPKFKEFTKRYEWILAD